MPIDERRLTKLLQREADFTGLDFVRVEDGCDQTVLEVFFLTDLAALVPPLEGGADPLTAGAVHVRPALDEGPEIEVEGLAWRDDPATGRRVLVVTLEAAGGFEDHRLSIDDPRVDRGFAAVRFNFKVACEERRDCATPTDPCPPEGLSDFPVDYLARDFVSFRNALLDFAAQRHPDWSLPKEADLGMVLLEMFAAVGDELSYVQDRLHREAGFMTSSERRSLRKKARLVDYEVHDGRMAQTWLELAVLPGVTSVPAGAPVWALARGLSPVTFTLGARLEEVVAQDAYGVDARWNPGALEPYGFDERDECLPVGATAVYVKNPLLAAFDAVDAESWRGRTLVLRERPPVDEPHRPARVVKVIVEEVRHDERDALYDEDLARIEWRAEDALEAPIDLARLELSGNVVPACAGRVRHATFKIGPLTDADVAAGVIEAVEREGPLRGGSDPALLLRKDPCEPSTERARTVVYLLSLPGTEAEGLGFWDRQDDLRSAEPEVRVGEVVGPGAPPNPSAWTFVRTLMGESGDDEVFTLEDGTWREIVAYPRPGGALAHRDYASGAGYTVRFGDGEFGKVPTEGQYFRVDYRLGGGTLGNVAAGAVRASRVYDAAGAAQLDEDGNPLISPLEALLVPTSARPVHNPLPVDTGVDPESAEEVRQVAPAAYASTRLFAVRPEDYGEQAETLDFVQRAQSDFRWTGSWLTAVTAADPIGASSLSEARRRALEGRLACRRQAGRDVLVVEPRYADLDLEITICVAPDHYLAHVARAVKVALFGRRGSRPVQGFFHPDRFTFGTPLFRSALCAAVQAVPGVAGVERVRYRRLGVAGFSDLDADRIEIDSDEVIRVEDDPTRPERGLVQLIVEGGA